MLVEDKGYSLALHYRQVPKQGVALIHDVKHAYEAWGDQSIELLAGKAVLELKFAGFNKGTAVRQLMTYPPFAGRAPIFVGDDHTDEDAFKVVPEFNGQAMSVGRKLPGIDKYFDCPADVRHWLGAAGRSRGGFAMTGHPTKRPMALSFARSALLPRTARYAARAAGRTGLGAGSGGVEPRRHPEPGWRRQSGRP